MQSLVLVRCWDVGVRLSACPSSTLRTAFRPSTAPSCCPTEPVLHGDRLDLLCKPPASCHAVPRLESDAAQDPESRELVWHAGWRAKVNSNIRKDLELRNAASRALDVDHLERISRRATTGSAKTGLEWVFPPRACSSKKKQPPPRPAGEIN